MTHFKEGDRVRFVTDYLFHPFAIAGDTATVVKDSIGDCTQVIIDRTGEKAYPYSHRLELIGGEPQSGEQYLDRAVKWVESNSDAGYEISVADVFLVAQFLFDVEQNK